MPTGPRPSRSRSRSRKREAFIDAAFVAFGQGSGHPAALNFGDMFGYALARVRGLPLLYKGSDFSETDLASAAPR